MYPNGHSFFSEIEIKKFDFNTSLTLFLEIEIKKFEVNNSLILILQKWSKSRRKLFTQTCLNNYQVVGVKTLLLIVLTWIVWNLAKWKKEMAIYKTRNTGTGNRMRRIRERGECSLEFRGMLLFCYFRECWRRFRAMFPKIPGNFREDSG